MANATALYLLSNFQAPLRVPRATAPRCVVAVDRNRARFFRYASGALTQIEMRAFAIDKSQWKMKDHAHMARRNTRMPHGAERDVFKKRLAAQYQHFCRETAQEIRAVCQRQKLTGIFLVGSARLIEPIAAALPPELQADVTLIPKDLARFSLAEMKLHLQPVIAKHEAARDSSLVESLLSAERGVVRGIDETLAQLQEGNVRKLLAAPKFDSRLNQCAECGLVDFSADPRCPKCGGRRKHVQLRDALPALAKECKSALEYVSGQAADKLMEVAGVGGWLRPHK